MPPEARGISITFSSARAFESKARVFIRCGSVPAVIIGLFGRFCDFFLDPLGGPENLARVQAKICTRESETDKESGNHPKPSSQNEGNPSERPSAAHKKATQYFSGSAGYRCGKG